MKLVFDNDGSAWDANLEPYMNMGSCIIALRGAGSYNGIARPAADQLLAHELHNWILSLPKKNGFLVFMYDGDNDSGVYPDIGYMMGRLRDFWAGNVKFLAAQRDDWYSGNGKPIRSHSDYPDSGREYDTFVFPHGVFPGEHNRFTQSEKLVAYPNYHQIYVGACGKIARDQLIDLDAKVPSGQKADVAVFRCKVNPEQTDRIHGKIAKARTEGDIEKIKQMEAALKQRDGNPYGLLYTPDGERLPFWNELSNVDFSEFKVE